MPTGNPSLSVPLEWFLLLSAVLFSIGLVGVLTRRNVLVIFMSGYNEEAVLRHGVLAVGTSFIEKPFSPAELLERVRLTLDEAPPGRASIDG